MSAAKKQRFCLFVSLFWSVVLFKGRQMGHYVKVSLWCESLLTNTRFRVPYFRMNNYC